MLVCGPRRPPVVLLGHIGHREPAAAQQPRHRRKVFATKTPQYSNLFLGAVKQQPIVTVEVPVFRDGNVIYDISFSPPIAIFQAIIEKQRPSEDWTISIFDGDRVNFARVPNPQETVGKRASPLLDAEMARKSGSDAANGVARRRAADHDVCAILADRLERRRRHRGELAGRPVVAQPRHHQPDRRRAAAARPSPLRCGWRPRSRAARCCTTC